MPKSTSFFPCAYPACVADELSRASCATRATMDRMLGAACLLSLDRMSVQQADDKHACRPRIGLRMASHSGSQTTLVADLLRLRRQGAVSISCMYIASRTPC